MKKELYSVVHNHRHGFDNWTVRCAHRPTEEEVIEHCDIIFEPDRGEFIEITMQNMKDLIDIPEPERGCGETICCDNPDCPDKRKD